MEKALPTKHCIRICYVLAHHRTLTNKLHNCKIFKHKLDYQTNWKLHIERKLRNTNCKNKYSQTQVVNQQCHLLLLFFFWPIMAIDCPHQISGRNPPHPNALLAPKRYPQLRHRWLRQPCYVVPRPRMANEMSHSCIEHENKRVADGEIVLRLE